MQHLRLLPLLLLVSACSGGCNRPNETSGVADPTAKATHHGPPISASGALVADCKAESHEVKREIFGIAFGDARKELGATAHRWGGNTTSRYNFELGDAWNTAQDWYWQNIKIDSWEVFVKKAEQKGGYAAISVPTMGWIAKDHDSYSFSIAKMGNQKDRDPQPEKRDRGNGINLLGKELPPPPPETTSTRVTPEMVGNWVRRIKAADAKRPNGPVVRMYILDNEPGIWHTTHRDVHPEPLSYDELLEKTIAFATAIRKADPEALIAGPASYGWWEYFYSAKDHEAGFQKKPDRKAHGDVPLLEWYLRKLKEHEDKTGVRLLDVLDVHYYPQSDGVHGNEGQGEGTDDGTNKRRLRSVRSLWDPTYKDESWIDDYVQLLPRMKKIIADNYPGRKLSIGEYAFGGERHMNGAATLAEVLGKFAEYDVDFAFYWMAPKANTAAETAFQAYANYDGKGSRFGGTFVPVSAKTKDLPVSVYSARQGNKLVSVFINHDGQRSFEPRLDIGSCGTVKSVRSFGFDDAQSPLAAADARVTQKGSEIAVVSLPYSVTTVETTLAE